MFKWILKCSLLSLFALSQASFATSTDDHSFYLSNDSGGRSFIGKNIYNSTTRIVTPQLPSLFMITLGGSPVTFVSGLETIPGTGNYWAVTQSNSNYPNELLFISGATGVVTSHAPITGLGATGSYKLHNLNYVPTTATLYALVGDFELVKLDPIGFTGTIISTSVYSTHLFGLANDSTGNLYSLILTGGSPLVLKYSTGGTIISTSPLYGTHVLPMSEMCLMHVNTSRIYGITGSGTSSQSVSNFVPTTPSGYTAATVSAGSGVNIVDCSCDSGHCL